MRPTKRQSVWLSLFAYTIRLGVKLGLVKTEPVTPQERAYRRAHEGLHWLRLHLADSQVLKVNATSVQVRSEKTGQLVHLECSQGVLRLDGASPSEINLNRAFFDPRELPEFPLGPGGSADFRYQALERKLTVTVEAADDSLGRLGRHRAQIHFLLPSASPQHLQQPLPG